MYYKVNDQGIITKLSTAELKALARDNTDREVSTLDQAIDIICNSNNPECENVCCSYREARAIRANRLGLI